MTPTVIDLEAESKRPEQWKAVQEIWHEAQFAERPTGRPRTRAARIAEVLGMISNKPWQRVHLAGLDRPQSYEAFWARVGLMGR